MDVCIICCVTVCLIIPVVAVCVCCVDYRMQCCMSPVQNDVTPDTQQETEEKSGGEVSLVRPPLTKYVIHGE